MALQPQSANSTQASPGLYLITPRTDDPAMFLSGLVDDLGLHTAGMVAAVLVRLADADERTLINRVKTVTSSVQDQGVALLIDDHPDIVVRAGGDGAHVVGIEALTPALDLLKPERIVGVSGLKTRHDAMVAAEAGADYVMFGEPDAQGRRPSFEAIHERVAWWSEVFVVPCVAYAAHLEEVDILRSAGADFIAVEHLIFSDPRGPRAAMDDVMSRLHLLETSE
jgi:thiamine-phosphate pyrophosphorylase